MLSCDHCNRKYKTQKGLEKHRSRGHDNNRGKRHVNTGISNRGKRHVNTGNSNSQNHNQNLLLCPIFGCYHGFSSKLLLKNHFDNCHYFDTDDEKISKHVVCKNKNLILILKSVLKYIDVLIKSANLTDDSIKELIKNDKHNPVIVASANLLPQFWNKMIFDDELFRITVNQTSFAKRLINTGLFNSPGQVDWSKLLDDFTKFVCMGKPYFDSNFCPNIFIDLFWHGSMQNRDLYKTLFPNVMSHCVKRDSPDEEKTRYKYFLEVFEKRYKRSPYIPDLKNDLKNDLMNDSLTNSIFGIIKNSFFQSDEEMICDFDNSFNDNHKIVLEEISSLIKEIKEDEKIKQEKLEKEYQERLEIEQGIKDETSLSMNDIEYYCHGYAIRTYKEGYRGEILKKMIEKNIDYQRRNYDASC